MSATFFQLGDHRYFDGQPITVISYDATLHTLTYVHDHVSLRQITMEALLPIEEKQR